MGNTNITVLKMALKDAFFNVKYIGEDNWKEIARELSKLPLGVYVSEFEHHLYGRLKFEYHIHTNGIIDQLKSLYDQGISGGNPWFIGFYSRSYLEKIVAEGKSKRV